MSIAKPWKLLSKRDVSPNKWMPVESRTYEMANGVVVEDFTVTTVLDVAMVVPVASDGKVAMVRQFKPGAGEITLEFPAGRKEKKEEELEQVARRELLEETGIEADRWNRLGETVTFPTKGTERIMHFVAEDIRVGNAQKLDETEFIEVVWLTPNDVDERISQGEINTNPSLACWLLLKVKRGLVISG